jgi:hypothetical protein
MVQLHEALCDHKRMMIRQAGDTRAKPDVFCALGSRGNDKFRQSNQLPSRRVMLTDPRFVVPQPVKPFEQLYVARDG